VPPQRRAPQALAALVVLFGAALFVSTTENARWRSAAINLKASGVMPLVSWPQTLAGINLCALGDCLRGWVLGVVTLDRITPENPCPALWNTSYRPMRGRLEDEPVLEATITAAWYDTAGAPQVKQGDIVLEVGAWLGVFTHYALQRGARKVIAFEPEPVNAACFKQNFADEIQSGRVVLIDSAAWNAAGRVKLANVGPLNPSHSGKGFAVVEEGDTAAEAVTIDDTVHRLGIERVDFINMDIEGGERQAIAGARQTIARHRPHVAVCVHHLPTDRQVIPQLLLEIHPNYEWRTTDLKGYFSPASEPRDEMPRTDAGLSPGGGASPLHERAARTPGISEGHRPPVSAAATAASSPRHR